MNFLKSLLVIIGFLSLNCSTNAQNKVSAIDFEAKIKNQKVQLIDVRTPAEFASGHLKNAQNINYASDNFPEEMAKLDKTKAVYIYCAAGGRSGKAVPVLEQLGFKQIFDLEGGINAWKTAGKETIK
jgi:phage shock protein E